MAADAAATVAAPPVTKEGARTVAGLLAAFDGLAPDARRTALANLAASLAHN